MAVSPDVHLLEAQRELRRWVQVNDKKLESLMARDEDQVHRADNVSHMVYVVSWLVRILLRARFFSFLFFCLADLRVQLYSLGAQRDLRVQARPELRSGTAKT
jgi:hypothetical protein